MKAFKTSNLSGDPHSFEEISRTPKFLQLIREQNDGKYYEMLDFKSDDASKITRFAICDLL